MILGPQDKVSGITGLTMASRRIIYYTSLKWGREFVLVQLGIHQVCNWGLGDGQGKGERKIME